MLFKAINRKEALDYMKLVKDVLDILSIESIKGIEEQVYEIAEREQAEKLTVYDASYVAKALQLKCTLVTDDKKLHRIANKYVKTITSREI